MAEKFKFLEEIATADLAFEVYGKDLNELFQNAAEALFTAQANVSKVAAAQEREVSIEADNVQDLMFDWLQELIYLKDAEAMLFSVFELNVDVDDKARLTATIKGEPINMEKHELGVDVKAVTLHMFEVKQTDKGWYARVVVDI